ncbi:MAG: pyruvate formate lyase family protein, partial [Oscillospiraceae bacterium]|nr:pyruvate formate lyase family protein [Oscillospiraceae bacterium]
MYEFRPATERILRMKEAVRDRSITLDSERMVILTEAYSQLVDVVPIIQRSLACKYLVERASVKIYDDELIVGSNGPNRFSSPQYPEWGNISDWVIGAIDSGEWELRDGIYYSPPTDDLKQCMPEADYKAVKERMDFWKNHKVGRVADAWKPPHHAELERLAVSSYSKDGMGLCTLPEGHLVAGYDKVIFKGYKAIRAQAELWLESHYGNLMGEDVNKCLFYTAAINYLDSASLLCKRYSAECARLASECTEPKRKAELEMMADGLDWISEKPARTFWEACQAVMMYQLLLQMDSKIPSPALGRFDQYTWPLLKKELDEGTITLDEAQEIVDAFFLKANCFYSGGPAKLVGTTGIGNTYQHTIIGGVDPQTGENAENPVTYMVLETVGRLQLHDPTISLRINKNTSDKLWGLALQTSRMVGGLPLYQNDEVIIPSLIKELGFELEDARNYGIIGCQEIVGCGCDYPAPNGEHPPHASVFWGIIFSMAINDGKNPVNGEQSSVRTGYLYDMNSIEEVRDAVKKMGTHIMKMVISTNNYAEYLSSYYAPQT